jgi:hypothetical protein
MPLTVLCPTMLICGALQRESTAFPMPLLMLGLVLVSAMLLMQVHVAEEKDRAREGMCVMIESALVRV